MYKTTVKGKPITKKNSMRIVSNRKTGKPFPIPSKAYEAYNRLPAHLQACLLLL